MKAWNIFLKTQYSTSDNFIEFSIEYEVQTIANVIDSRIKSLSLQKCFRKKVPKKNISIEKSTTSRILLIKLWTQGEKKKTFFSCRMVKSFFFFFLSVEYFHSLRRNQFRNCFVAEFRSSGGGWKAKKIYWNCYCVIICENIQIRKNVLNKSIDVKVLHGNKYSRLSSVS